MCETAPQAPLPPHRGREATLEILSVPVASHVLSSRVLPRASCGPDDPEAPAVRLFLAVPKEGAPASGWPILYMLDGNAAFDFLTPALLESAPGLVLAGIGYDTEKQFARAHRIFDYSPPVCAGAAPRPDPHHPERLAGGAETYLARLTGSIRAEVERDLPVDPARRTLWGHSFGGLFTLYSALTRPESFARFAAISPSVWWDEALVARLVDTRSIAEGRARPLHFGMGDREKRTGSAGPQPDGPPAATLRAIERLRARPAGLEISAQVYPGAVHIAALPASLPGALALAARA
ncbi:alpha/beta hydrolase [Salipiger mangrovisoli]|uniref:Alpha/beta hydrolase n=1 Tax=Salipiger mangrovisoli TaxID=2865933 RepID=A0ABR9X387_9RHOB|nr:alpha/beta hydrolase-fold protein [Salipiger mangrovisoli]MBE9637981.1 alpha/beta hydrolase [Salipiger mangrovisoli]